MSLPIELPSTLALALCALALAPTIMSFIVASHYKFMAESPKLVYKSTPKNERLLHKCSHLVKKKFYPLWYLCNGHLQTLQLSWANEMDPTPAIPYERQLLDMPDGGVVSLDWALLPSSAKDDQVTLDQRVDASKKTVLVLPGLTGGSGEHYIRTAVERLNSLGWQCVVFNSRGCQDTPLRTPHLFCIAYTGDLRFVARYLTDKFNFTALIGLGFSMGSNVLVKYLGEDGDQVRLTAGISVGNPFDMANCSKNIEGPLFNRLTYSRVLSAGLSDLFFNRSNAHEVFRDHPGLDLEALKKVKKVSEFDELFTIKHFNYKSVDEFYQDGSCVTRLPKVTVPLLCLNAEDDPISVATSLPTKDMVEANENIILCTTKSGGHLAFYEGDYDEDDDIPSIKKQKFKRKLRPCTLSCGGHSTSTHRSHKVLPPSVHSSPIYPRTNMSVAVKGVVRLRVLAGKASPSPAIGQALGPLGVNMMEFCKAFNDRTSKMTENIPVPVVLTAYTDRTFNFATKTPPASWFLKKAAGIKSGSSTPGQQVVGTVHLRQIYEIAKVKQQDEMVDYIDIKSICKTLIGSAKSMGLEVVP
ncbi:hypothetical protein PC129_g1111 [Phytophthora cactorum]|uniref:Large ribosomal subunit protein uL11m n=1 Tax=Phytophthora cactorum TaxID=29920 RepID=A0A8T1ITG6_9STRA|nr:hypothetical protein PC118_g14894 [Phytophthora cactorum]KAG3228354.1 hypothetical protein PC129_g1111 [Phytophthora cactorum]